MFFKIGLAVVVLTAVSGALAFYQLDKSAPKGVVAFPSGRLVCSEEAHSQYMKIVGQVGEMGIGLNATLENPDDVTRLMAAYDGLNLEGPETVIVSGHVPTGQLYQNICANERCTMEEMAKPFTQCQMDHFNDCTDVAIRFRGQEFCMIAPAQVAP